MFLINCTDEEISCGRNFVKMLLVAVACHEILLIQPSLFEIIICMKKLLNSDWLRAVQFKCNTVQKM